MAQSTFPEEGTAQQSEFLDEMELSTDLSEMIREDHELVESLFARFEETEGEEAEREMVAEQIFQALEIHSQLEEQLIYPTARADVYEEGDGMITDFEQAHQKVKELIGGLQNLPLTDAGYLTLFDELMEHVRTHVEEEESALLPDIDGLPLDQLERLVKEYQQRKEELLAHVL